MREELRQFDFIFEPLNGLEAFESLARSLQRDGVYSAYGLDDTQRAHLLAALALRADRPLLVLTPNEMAAQRLTEDLNVLLAGRAAMLPPRDISFLRTAASSHELSMRRIEALGRAATGELSALVVPVDAMLHRLISRERFLQHVIEIDESMRLNPTDLIERLVAAGYERVQIVESRGQCALRGGILDVYPVGEANALRIEFFDDEIDSLRSFDVMTQRSISNRTSPTLYPAAEMLMEESEVLRAAHELDVLLRSGTQGTEEKEDRQKQIEREFDLMPFEDFLELTYAGGDEDELPEIGALFAAPK